MTMPYEAGELVRLAHRPHDPGALRIVRVGGGLDQRVDLLNGDGSRYGRDLVSMRLPFWADWLLPEGPDVPFRGWELVR